jgi:hypothetical protein
MAPRSVRMAITATLRMRAPLTGTMARRGLTTASLSGPDPGSGLASMEDAGIMGAATMVVVDTTDVVATAMVDAAM